jgi:hypothetical protein
MSKMGGARAGAGRKKGGANKKTREIADKAAEEGLTPLEYMLEVLRNTEETPENRRWAAEKAAPYIHPRLQAVEHSGKDGGPMHVTFETIYADSQN